MTKPISVGFGDLYSAPNWVFHWVVGFLWRHLDDPVDQEDLRGQTLADYVDLGVLSERARSRLLRALAEDLIPSVGTVPAPYGEVSPKSDQRLREELGPLARAAASALDGPDAPTPVYAYRLPLIVVSDTYNWPMPFGMFDFLVRLLRDRVGDGFLLDDGRIDLRRLRGPLQAKALRTLADDAQDAAPEALRSMVVGSPGRHGGYWDNGRALKEVRVIALIARQVLYEGASIASGSESDCAQSSPMAEAPGLRRIVLDEDYLWMAEADVYRYVIQFLSRRPGLRASARKFADAPWLDISTAFSDATRVQVLKALAIDLSGAADSNAFPGLDAGRHEAGFDVGRLKTLALMAADVLAQQR